MIVGHFKYEEEDSTRLTFGISNVNATNVIKLNRSFGLYDLTYIFKLQQITIAKQQQHKLE